ncbi:thermonuclease family protein [Maridesulfovibrio sp.]|uniref:thermonuclease family protein n=1 Tax=Maridesulfovibrio sp. TaxID=2795000 RepID=UPI0029CA2E0A|nr:thermonuclease family protein [Maridesulfovibrio sp.]
MNKIIVIFTILLSILASSAYAEQFEYIRPKDGDSFTVRLRGLEIDLRLISVDCPEYDQEYGQDARAFTDRWLRQGPAEIEYDNRTQDRYGRVLGYVWRKGEMLNLELARRGYCVAVLYTRTQKHFKEIRAAEQLAKKEKLGIWENGGLRMSPSTFRQKKRRNRNK